KPTQVRSLNVNSGENGHYESNERSDDVHPFQMPKEERDNLCNRCWYECGSYSTIWPYSLIIIIVVYALIAPIGWRIVDLRKQLDDTLVFPRDSQYLATYKDVEKDFSPGILASWYVIIPDPEYEAGNSDKNVHSWTYVNDTGTIMTAFYEQLAAAGYPMSSSIGVSVWDNRTFTNQQEYDYAARSSAYNDFVSSFISSDNSTTYFKMISAFDPYYSNAIDFVSYARDTMSNLCGTAAPSKMSYRCYLTGGSTNEVDLVNTIFAQFPYVLLGIVMLVFCIMGAFFASAFVPLRLFITIAVPLTLVYGLSISVYQDGWLEGLHWSAVGNTQGLYWLSPVMTITILIGLALDYDVFLFARVYEYRVHGLPTRESIVRGVYNTGSIITAAGVIMAIAFCGLLFSQMTSLNQTGFILVVAVLVDTFIIRTLLVPAVLSMAKLILYIYMHTYMYICVYIFSKGMYLNICVWMCVCVCDAAITEK
ncbi:MmpL efflux pump, partial [Reticulomyxa filosa]